MTANLTWFQARDLAKTGVAIRRAAWERWLVRGLALWFTSATASDGTAIYHVVTTEEMTAADFMALDWTTDLWAVGVPVPVGVDTTTGSTPASAPAGPSVGAVGTDGATPPITPFTTATFGTSSNPPGPGAKNPPAPSGGGGGGGGSKSDDTDPTDKTDRKKTDASPAVSPTITVQIAQPTAAEWDAAINSGQTYDSVHNCISPVGDVGSPMVLARLDVQVTIAGGPLDVGTLSVQLGSGSPQLGTGWPGMNQGFEFTGVNFYPGSAFTVTATYVIGMVTYTGTGTIQTPGWCGWTPPTKILFTVPTIIGSTVSATIATNGDTSSGDTNPLTASSGTLGTSSIAPAGSSTYSDAGVTFPDTFTLTYDWAPGGRILSGTVTVHMDGSCSFTGDCALG